MDRPYRLGLKYDTMKAQSAVLHKCDRSRIPSDAVIIKTEIRSTYHSISRIEEQQVEYITYRTREGRLITAFYPMKGAAEAVVREKLKEDLKAARCEGITPILKNFHGTYVSVDMLVSLAFNKYMMNTPVYCDMSPVEHVCCMAHVRAKFQKALERGGEERSRRFINWIGKLYKFEEDYKKEQLSPAEIKRRRNSAITTSLIGDLWQELSRLQDESIPKGDLMQKALNYFMHTWDCVMAYRHDGRYEIDNSVVERFIRLLTVERKNSLFFGSHKGVETSAVYHTFIATCRMRVLSFCEFLKKYITAILDGRTDYENLTPALLG
ncbi:IS66 family transposase [Parabacteroides pacaensis]|uniref:IS66 family transposase n=1 Tax=Parabacteroides pacaensis TaxID=2086575 RepID=UPI000D1147A3|nr:transposase [Parabacteroides pacaensis]